MANQQLADVASEEPEPGSSGAPEAREREVPRYRRGRELSDGSRLYWFKELAIILSVYFVYESVRNISKGRPSVAFDNALQIIGWQKALGINHEKAIQDWALNYFPLIVVSNYYYGIAYIACTIVILLWMYRRQSDDYPLWRNTLLFGTLLGLIGFATYPLMPPRLLDEMGDGRFFGFVDTLVKYPTFWSFESSAMQKVSNQFAAMPSLHCGWASVGSGRGVPPREELVDEDAGDLLPGGDDLRGRGHRQPLLPRRRRRRRDLPRRLRHRSRGDPCRTKGPAGLTGDRRTVGGQVQLHHVRPVDR